MRLVSQWGQRGPRSDVGRTTLVRKISCTESSEEERWERRLGAVGYSECWVWEWREVRGGEGAALAETAAAVRLHSSSLTHLTVMLTTTITILASLASLSATTRLDLRPSQACYHQPYNRELVCQCRDGANYLNLRLSEFVDRARQEVGGGPISLGLWGRDTRLITNINPSVWLITTNVQYFDIQSRKGNSCNSQY